MKKMANYIKALEAMCEINDHVIASQPKKDFRLATIKLLMHLLEEHDRGFDKEQDAAENYQLLQIVMEIQRVTDPYLCKGVDTEHQARIMELIGKSKGLRDDARVASGQDLIAEATTMKMEEMHKKLVAAGKFMELTEEQREVREKALRVLHNVIMTPAGERTTVMNHYSIIRKRLAIEDRRIYVSMKPGVDKDCVKKILGYPD